MFTEQFFELLLDFGDEWVVKEVETAFELNEVDIFVEFFSTKSGFEGYDYAPNRRWRQLDTMQFKTFINCRLPRSKRADGGIETVTSSWAEKHHRHWFLFEIAVISLLMATKNQRQRARLASCSFDFRTLEACQTLLESALSEAEREKVKTIRIDIREACLSVATEKLPNAEIVHDRFHLVKYLNQAIDKGCRREVKEHALLKDSRYPLLKNEENLTQKQRVKCEAIRAANCEVGKDWHCG